MDNQLFVPQLQSFQSLIGYSRKAAHVAVSSRYFDRRLPISVEQPIYCYSWDWNATWTL